MARNERRGVGGRVGRGGGVASAEPAWLVVGRIVRTHGTRGKVLVAPSTDFPERFEPGSRLWIGDDEAHLLPVEVIASDPYRGFLRLALGTVPGDEPAPATVRERFVSEGRFLFVPTDDLAVAGEGRYYYHELIGCRVATLEGEEVGEVKAVIRPGPQDLLIIDGGARGEVFVPIVEAIVREVDLEGRRVMIDPPGGLLDINVAKC